MYPEACADDCRAPTMPTAVVSKIYSINLELLAKIYIVIKDRKEVL